MIVVQTDQSVGVLDDARDLALRVLAEVPVRHVLEVRAVPGRRALAHDLHVAVVVHPQLTHDYIVDCCRYLTKIRSNSIDTTNSHCVAINEAFSYIINFNYIIIV